MRTQTRKKKHADRKGRPPLCIGGVQRMDVSVFPEHEQKLRVLEESFRMTRSPLIRVMIDDMYARLLTRVEVG